MYGITLLAVASGLALRGPEFRLDHTLVSTHVSAVDALGALLEVVRRDASECAAYVKSTLDELATAYTAVQVPAVLESVCRSGRFFHAFADAEECKAMAEKLLDAYYHSEGQSFDAWCKELEQLVDTETRDCECVPLPASVMVTKDNTTEAVAKDNTTFAPSYGATCAPHDLEREQYCAGREYMPAFCHESWCYVSKDCKAADKKGTFLFEGELYYSYKACGGVDAFAAEACAAFGADCEADSANCAWNEASKVCQNKLCQCTGLSEGLNLTMLGYPEDFGQSCSAWDEDHCDTYEGHEPAMWCCKTWCFVDEGCPSAQPSVLHSGLFVSYLACPDDGSKLAQCKWKEPVTFDGEPLPITSTAATELNKA